MSTLHLISRSPSQGLLTTCATLLRGGDGVVFIEDGVYYCVQQAALAGLPADVELYCLRDDLIARGAVTHATQDVETVSYDRFVELCCEFTNIVSWF